MVFSKRIHSEHVEKPEDLICPRHGRCETLILNRGGYEFNTNLFLVACGSCIQERLGKLQSIIDSFDSDIKKLDNDNYDEYMQVKPRNLKKKENS